MHKPSIAAIQESRELTACARELIAEYRALCAEFAVSNNDLIAQSQNGQRLAQTRTFDANELVARRSASDCLDLKRAQNGLVAGWSAAGPSRL